MKYRQIIRKAIGNNGFKLNFQTDKKQLEIICQKYNNILTIPFKEIDKVIAKNNIYDAIEIIGLEIALSIQISENNIEYNNRKKKT